ncbi:Uu.00g039090.m01.CDS01 [Anthostomella pinea]|uniref:Uu.00g039090.m01.CDS01 n=1 Tax=Anthostomella pinea TaxID=933095 RepID=A0AAI8VAZ4_9PEZI|nr:Uu.00g039090.m01.CDS01 [Anthostomella pinea]
MPTIRGPLWALHLAAVLSAASAASIRPESIFERGNSCAANFTKCSQAGLPDNFCCEAGTSCLVLAGSTTVLCCPSGSSCDTINPITCNVALQDAAANPAAEIKTTVLDGKLETCSTGCCPYGYSCVNDNCVMDQDQSKKPAGKSNPTTSSTHAAPTTTASSKPSTTAVQGGVTSAAPSKETTDPTAANTMNTAAIVGGVVGGIAAIGLIAVAVMVCRRRRKKEQKMRQNRSSSWGNIGNIPISAPMPHADYDGNRQDFLSKARSTSVASTPTQAQERFPPNSPYSPYSSSGRPESEMSDAPRSYHPSAEVGGLHGERNLTDMAHRYSGTSIASRERRQHSAGSESINIFADALTVGGGSAARPLTTWTDIQSHAERVPDSPVRRR